MSDKKEQSENLTKREVPDSLFVRTRNRLIETGAIHKDNNIPVFWGALVEYLVGEIETYSKAIRTIRKEKNTIEEENEILRQEHKKHELSEAISILERAGFVPQLIFKKQVDK